MTSLRVLSHITMFPAYSQVVYVKHTPLHKYLFIYSKSSEPPGTRRLVREDSNASNSMESTTQPMIPPRDIIKRAHSQEAEPMRIQRTETITTPIDTVIDLSKKSTVQSRSANFYQETLITEPETTSVIRVNPSYTPQPSTSQYPRIDTSPKTKQKLQIDLPLNNNVSLLTAKTPITPIINIDFSKNICKPEIKVLDTTATNAPPLDGRRLQTNRSVQEPRKIDLVRPPVDVDSLSSGNLQIDEDYDT
ncbi:hypothetical protein EVAR_79206_1 [Eumeta japonica]|uniref:Uncharacterized protein n=1 Tax=Eumeta variegata TaxID=151549 RepID=A0A4C1UUF8_EUMVA|nr:hypothetical protein EVAR_79206_1 [Eumeta japonica]